MLNDWGERAGKKKEYRERGKDGESSPGRPDGGFCGNPVNVREKTESRSCQALRKLCLHIRIYDVDGVSLLALLLFYRSSYY